MIELPEHLKQAAAKGQLILDAVDQFVKDNWWPGEPPEGTRLEIHPSVYNHLMMTLDVYLYGGGDIKEAMEKRIQLPLVVTPLLPKDHWRLVTVIEEVHLGGTLPAVD